MRFKQFFKSNIRYKLHQDLRISVYSNYSTGSSRLFCAIVAIFVPLLALLFCFTIIVSQPNTDYLFSEICFCRF